MQALCCAGVRKPAPLIGISRSDPCTDIRLGLQVFLGASAVNSNGTVVSRIGSAAVAMMADAAGVPVIICCETYKFSSKVLP